MKPLMEYLGKLESNCLKALYNRAGLERYLVANIFCRSRFFRKWVSVNVKERKLLIYFALNTASMYANFA